MSNFKEKYLKDEVTIVDLDDFIDIWHKGTEEQSLQDFLGLSDEEYLACSHGETKLKQLLDKQKKQQHKTASKLMTVLTQIVKK
jgi:hypothetical protein